MPLLSANKLNEILSGKLLGQGKIDEKIINTIAIDSRTIINTDSCCFFAIKGDRNDGHKYINKLIRQGVQNFVISEFNEEWTTNYANFILVEDTLKSLQQVAAWNRKQYPYPVVGITGSNGKTIIKEWLFEILKDELRIVRNPKSYNSQVGVPLSVWLMDESYELAIFEAGISEPNEMQNLSDILLPDTGIFTNIGEAHQENFSSIEQKITEKLKLFKSSKNIIYCADHKLVAKLINQTYPKKNLFGWSIADKNAQLYFAVSSINGYTFFTFSFGNIDYQIKIPFTDQASVENAAHCAAYLALNDLLKEDILDRFEQLQTVAMRLELKDGINNCKLINDYYNSDINSLGIALSFQEQQNLASVKGKTLILSDIQQSGLSSKKLYKEVNRMIKANNISRLIGIGEAINLNKDIFDISSEFYQSTDEFLTKFRPSSFKDELILLKGARDFHFERISSVLQKKYHQTVLEINLNQMVDNLNIFKSKLKSETKVMVMVKAFSYGSGTAEIAKTLQYQQVDYLAVAVADEGIDLRKSGIETPIVVMNPEEHSFESMIEFRLEPNIYSIELLKSFEAVLKKNAVNKYPIHLKLETGMKRLGFSDKDALLELSEILENNSTIYVASIFSHLAASDESQHDSFTKEQIKTFTEYAEIITNCLPYKPLLHILNSAGIERFPEYQFDMVRLGIGLYGVSAVNDPAIKSISKLQTSISQIRQVDQDETIGYGRKGKVSQKSEIAVLPIGYADGYLRRLSNGKGKVFVKGKLAPIVGNICMDMCMVDVTGIDAKVGDSVELFGDNISLNTIADWMETIPYEILTGVSQRVKRIYIQE